MSSQVAQYRREGRAWMNFMYLLHFPHLLRGLPEEQRTSKLVYDQEYLQSLSRPWAPRITCRVCRLPDDLIGENEASNSESILAILATKKRNFCLHSHSQ